jgi:ABC-type amino acid transport substrate-binding protein
MSIVRGPSSRLTAFALALAVLAVALSGTAWLRSARAPAARGDEGVPGVLERISKSRELHAGYGVYPPYSIEDPNTKKVTGYSIDVIEEIAKTLGVKVVWHRVNWDTMSADLKRGEFDVVADPIFQTIPRAPEFAFSDPYAYFPDGIGVVRAGDTRFKTFESLDHEGVRISVGLGQASEALVRSRIRRAQIVPVAASTDNMRIFEDVLAGRTDVAVADLPNAKRVVEAHPTRLQALWTANPPAYMLAGFALKPTDERGAKFFSVSIRYLHSTGILKTIADRYGLSIDIPRP